MCATWILVPSGFTRQSMLKVKFPEFFVSLQSPDFKQVQNTNDNFCPIQSKEYSCYKYENRSPHRKLLGKQGT